MCSDQNSCSLHHALRVTTASDDVDECGKQLSISHCVYFMYDQVLLRSSKPKVTEIQQQRRLRAQK